jgi:hypothetical protein
MNRSRYQPTRYVSVWFLSMLKRKQIVQRSAIQTGKVGGAREEK